MTFRRASGAAFTLLLALLGLSCSHYSYVANGNARPSANRDTEIGLFKYERRHVDVSMEFKEETNRYSMYLVKFNIRDFPEITNRFAKTYYFVQKTAGKSPCIVVLPPTGGGMELVEMFAKYFAQRGFTAIGFYRREMFFNPKQDLEYNKNLFRQSVIDVRRAIDFLQGQPGVDPDKIGIMGASLGGIISALAMEADKRLQAMVTMVAAGDLPMILDRSNYSRIYRFRRSLMERYHLQREDIYRFGRKGLTDIDPLAYAERIDPSRVLMINGSLDTIVPLAAARETWEAFGRPEWRILPVSHYTSMLMIEYAQHISLVHFRRVMNVPEN
jgi:hypothetical protein